MVFSNEWFCLVMFDESCGNVKEVCCLEELLKNIYFSKISYGLVLWWNFEVKIWFEYYFFL